MNRGAVGIVGGMLLGAAVGWYVRPATSMLASRATAASTATACHSAVDKHRFENTRAALARTLGHMAKDPSVAAGSLDSMPGLIELVRMTAWDAPIETARMVVSAGLYEGFEAEALRVVARTWFGRDGASIIQTLVNENAYDELKRFYLPVFTVVAVERPFEALEPIMALEDQQLRTWLFTSVSYPVTADEVPKLAQVLMTLQVGERQRIVRNVGSELAQKNPEFALAWTASLTPVEVAALRSQALRTIAQSDPARALSLAAAGGKDRVGIEIGALEVLAGSDPAGAILVFEESDDVNEKRTMLPHIVRGWATTDAPAAAQWVASLSANFDVSEALQTVAGTWARQDIDAAAAFTNKLSARDRNGWIVSVSQAFMYEDTEQYLQWIEQFRSESFYGLLLNQAVWPLERNNPETAASYVLALDPAIRNEPLQKLIEQVSEYDPQRAAGWLSQISDDSIRLASMDRVILAWNYQAPDDLAQWIDTLPPGAIKDAALAALVAHSGKPNVKSLSDRIVNRDARVQALFSRGVPAEAAREIVAILHDISLDERQWKALENELASVSP